MGIRFSGEQEEPRATIPPTARVEQTARNVAQQPVKPRFATGIDVAQLLQRIEKLERELTELRAMIARQAVAGAGPAQKSRAEYYREYRKRPKVQT